MTPLEEIITRNTDRILDALQARFNASPRDPELEALFQSAAEAVSLMFPGTAATATPEQRELYLASLQERLDTLPGLFRQSRDPARALRNLAICWHLVDRLLEKQYLDAEAANNMQGQVLTYYAVYAPVEPLQ